MKTAYKNSPKTLDDAAKEFGVTTATISYALSGKGRVSKELKERIQKWAKENDFRPNLIAKSLAQKKSYNIGIIIPENTDNIFFHRCIVVITQQAVMAGYDTVNVIDDDTGSISNIEKVVRNKKIDGTILTRSKEGDNIAKFLKKEKIPFVLIGSSSDKKIFQVDVNHKQAAYDMTLYILRRGIKNIIFLGGLDNFLVNQNRLEGFCQAFKDSGVALEKKNIAMNITTETGEKVGTALKSLLTKKIECVVCMDDILCKLAVDWIKTNRVDLCGKIKIASFYDGPIFAESGFKIDAVFSDTDLLNITATHTLIDILDGKNVPHKTWIPHELVIRDE